MKKITTAGALGVLLSTLMLTGCTMAPTARAVAPAVVHPPLEVGYCIDTTASVNGALVGPGLALLKRHLQALVRPGFPGLHLHVRKIGGDSWSPQAELVTAGLPAIGTYPVKPHIGYFDAASSRRRREHAYQQARAAVDGQMRAARGQLHALEGRLAALRLPVEHGTDVGGCAAKFALLFAGTPGPHSLTILSDLAPSGQNTAARPRFTGRTAVTVVLYCYGVSDAAACEGRSAHFGTEMRAAGATSYRAYDVANIDFIPVPH